MIESIQYEQCINFRCEFGKYKCNYYSYCIAIHLVCDGVTHCLQEDDEINCGILQKIKLKKVLTLQIKNIALTVNCRNRP